MCGIAGYLGNKPLPEERISSTLQSLINRGPDARRFVSIEASGNYISLLHGRLSIIDLDERSHQPFSRYNCTLVFNGEIYNYIELRNDLLRRNIALTTSSDTEVLLEYYMLYGDRCVEYFEGMWAFALYDGRNGTLTLSRDRFAEKPLYYFKNQDGIYFGSETKFLKTLSGQQPEVNEQHLLRFMINGHKSLYKTDQHFYKGVHELPPASIAKFYKDKDPDISIFWKPTLNINHGMTENEAIEGARHHLIESLKLRLRSDVPLAFCLSGGVDSASLVSIASKIFNAKVNTFSIIDSDKRYDEQDNIEATINDTGCANTKIMLQPGEHHIKRLEDLIRYHDAPVATISYFVHSMLSEAIASNKFRISISGTGADEMFTGYYDHFIMHLYELRNDPELESYKHDWEQHVLQFVRHPDFRKWNFFFDKPEQRSQIYLNNQEFSSMLKKGFSEEFTETTYCDSLLRNRMMNEMFHEVVRVILHEDDLNSMKYSIENRSPFLDTSLFNFAYSIPTKLLIKNGYNKYLLRESMKGILNDQVRMSREKKGFNASINSIFDFENPRHRDYFLSDSKIFDWFDKEKIANLLMKKEFPNSYKKFLFDFIGCKIFLDQQ